MIEVTTNITAVVGEQLAKIRELKSNPDPILRTVALAVLPEMKKRVHVDGLDSEGKAIGTYSAGYMTVRTGAYQNSGRVSRGANKGKLKDAGKYTKGTNTKIFGTIVEESSKAGLDRPKYNRTADNKVILSLTRQMENDLSVVESPEGYGIGYLNPFNLQKATWCEATYKKPILTALTKEELELAGKTAQDFLPIYLNQ